MALPQLLPWLFRLADENNAYVQSVVLPQQRARLTKAAKRASPLDDPETASKYSLLFDTFVCVWGAPAQLSVRTSLPSVRVSPATRGAPIGEHAHSAGVDDLLRQLPSPGESPLASDLTEVRRSMASLRELQRELTAAL